MTTTQRIQVGQSISLPDGPYGKIIRIEDGVEHGDTVKYVTVVNSLGNEVTRWMR